jgi:hypothetical protein
MFLIEVNDGDEIHHKIQLPKPQNLFIMCLIMCSSSFCGFCDEYLPAKIHPSNSYPATAVIVRMVY